MVGSLIPYLSRWIAATFATITIYTFYVFKAKFLSLAFFMGCKKILEAQVNIFNLTFEGFNPHYSPPPFMNEITMTLKELFINLLATFIAPAILAILAITWLTGDYGPSQSLAHKASAAILALTILFCWLRIADLIMGTNMPEVFNDENQNGKLAYFRWRYMANALLIGLVFAFA